MSTTFDADKILRDNPQLDSKNLQPLMELYEKLRALGVKPHGFRLAPMGGGQRVAMKERKDDDAAAALDAFDCSGPGVIR